MSARFEEIDYQPTAIGALSLRRRRDAASGEDIFEIKLGDDFLMSSNFTASEIALADLGLDELAASHRPTDVLVGGLGLGYTAHAALKNTDVKSLCVVELFEPVISWHKKGFLPLGKALSDDPRCRLIQGDFFKMAASEIGFDAKQPGRKFDVILLDIDHAPEVLLTQANEPFYKPEGLAKLASHLKPGGVFGLWSNERPDIVFTSVLASAFDTARAKTVTFPNPLQDDEFTQAVYLATAR